MKKSRGGKGPDFERDAKGGGKPQIWGEIIRARDPLEDGERFALLGEAQSQHNIGPKGKEKGGGALGERVLQLPGGAVSWGTGKGTPSKTLIGQGEEFKKGRKRGRGAVPETLGKGKKRGVRKYRAWVEKRERIIRLQGGTRQQRERGGGGGVCPSEGGLQGKKGGADPWGGEKGVR